MAASSVESSVKDALNLLKKFDWIHSPQVIKIFDGTLQNIPSEWLPFLAELDTQELNNLPYLGESSSQVYPAWPTSLHEFLQLTSQLSLLRGQIDLQPTAIDANMARGMNQKKLHEVSYMASLVHNVMSEAGCDLIVDVGSGLGYLDHVLHQVHHHAVLGLEVNDSHVTRAETRAAAQGLQCGGVKSVKFNLTYDTACFQQFESLLSSTAWTLTCHCNTAYQADLSALNGPVVDTRRATLRSPRVCLIGLHCCGDLSPTMLALFHQVPSVRAVCCVSCCYHKMSCVSDELSSFPLSSSCKKIYDTLKTEGLSWHISPQTLRLGAQETRSRWRQQTEEDHFDHVRHVAYRGLLELAECGDPVMKRKLVRKCDFSSFNSFLHSYFSSTYFSEDEISRGKLSLNYLYTKHKDEFQLIEIFTALQTLVQPVIESLIYNDRLLWLMERGYTNVKVLPVFNEAVSPRNLAIAVIK
ncbi:hypothetical protein RRG08_016328 [Elysia crispata]|uniref:Methyltransferase domain-containing protein n=1 Tax=Elysia crispata TaxID=231223 RepID=A0AAE1AMU0_9GAST|nr:hypothetical protein RRG08_016328 [Elysia crispata]